MTAPEVDGPSGRFRSFFNPATGEHIEFTAVAEDNNGEYVRFHWRSVPGGIITEHIHPHQEERFTIVSGEAVFTLNGQEHVARAGETVVVPAGVPHSEGNNGPVAIDGVVELRPALHSKQWHEALAGLIADGRTTARGGTQEPAPARCHLLALPTRKPSHHPSHLGPEPHPPTAVGAGQSLGGAPLRR
jgi:quercetin dioxygenase-like cupin family protein